MRYKAEYDEYSETNKFLDELFQEDCELEWGAQGPDYNTNNALNITVVKDENEAEKTYLQALASEIAEKLSEIIEKFDTLPDEKDKEVYFNKNELISRIISVNNSIDAILCDLESSATANKMNGTLTVIGGGFPMM